MMQERLYKVLVGPVISEKATMMGEKANQIAFRVLRDANKAEIKAAVELLFKVEVVAVNVVNIKGKTKRFGRVMGRHSDVRKAYVTLKKGQEINFAEVK